MPWSRLYSATIHSTIALSQLSPPRWLSPEVDLTSNTPSPISSTETSNVPPPRSKTRIVWSVSLSSPYASEAAVGSLMMRLTSRPATLPASFVAWRWSSLKYAGTVMTALSTVSPRYASASAFSLPRIIALTSGGLYCLPPASMRASPPGPETTLYGTIDSSSRTSASLRPMKRLTEKTVLVGLVTACRLATVPTSRSPLEVNATTDGVVRPPSAFSITVGSPPSRTAIQLLVVPRSMPIVLPMGVVSLQLPIRGEMKSKRECSRSHARCALGSGAATWTHAPQRAAGAVRSAGVTGATAVAQQAHVQLQFLTRRREREHRVMELLERRARTQQVQTHADARDVRVDRHVVQAVGEQQHARGRLATDAGQAREVRLTRGNGHVAQPAEIEPMRFVPVDRSQDLLDARRLDLRDPARPDRLLDLGVRRVQDRLPRREALAQPLVGDVAVAVVRRLREDGENQLVERLLVRRHDRHAVDLAQPVPDRGDAAPRRAPPFGSRDGGAGRHAPGR